MEQTSLFTDNPEYATFVDKFKPKKTTDDCYTPPLVYDAVRDWACEEYGIDPAAIVRPFYPGGDYEHYNYPHGCVVLDNPPFSILAKIVDFYLQREIPFFLFAPSLTALSSRKNVMRCNHIFCDAKITYENGAVVQTAFITSFGSNVVQTSPDLHEKIKQATDEIMNEKRTALPKYEYPANILTASMLQRYGKYSVKYSVSRSDCIPISALDSQREAGKSIYGQGLLLSEKAAAEKAAAEKAAAERAAVITWELSEREREMIAALG